MKILISGSGGFIGTYLMKALTGHKLLGVDKKYGIDVSDFIKLAKVTQQLLGKPDLIIHLAAQTSRKKSSEKPGENFKDNVLGTYNVLELARLSGAKIIFASSRYAIPNAEGKRDPYGFSKHLGEEYVEEYYKNYGVEFITNRIGNVYGVSQVGSSEAFWVAWFIKASKEKLPITIYGFEGKQSRDILYVEDLIRLLVDEVENFEKYKNKLYEVGGGLENEVSLIQALKFLNYDNYNFGASLPGDTKRLVFDNKAISAVNEWKPRIGWQEGFKRIIENET